MRKVYDITIKDLETILSMLKDNMYDTTVMMDAIRLEEYIKRIRNNFKGTDQVSTSEQMQDDLEYYHFYKPLYPIIERFIWNGMGVDEILDYFPVGYKKDGSSRGSFYSLQNFRNLSKIIDNKIINMGESLHKGEIAPVPCGSNGEGKMCKYCSYLSVCGYEDGDLVNEITNLSHADALSLLEVNDNE